MINTEELAKLPNLAKAVIAVMKDVKGVEKGLTVGSGSSSYKGVGDKEVKIVVGRAMAEHGLCILPTSVKPTLHIERWEEPDPYKKDVIKQKQQVFTEVDTKYILLHESGESIELAGYGHGVDSMDKSAGKSTTYALKYTLLYTFLVPTGDIDDGDATHSDDIELPKVKVTVAKPKTEAKKSDDSVKKPVATKPEKPILSQGTEAFDSAKKAVEAGTVTIAQIEGKYVLSPTTKKLLTDLVPKAK